MISITNIWTGFKEIGVDTKMFHIFPMLVWCRQEGLWNIQIGWLIWIVYLGQQPKDHGDSTQNVSIAEKQ